MLYLVNWSKHNGLFFALSTLVASFAALYSIKLFLLFIPIITLLWYKKFPGQFIVCLVIWSGLCYSYFEWRLVDNNDAPVLPATFTWTERYKINGAELRGFMEDQRGDRYYVVYKFASEQEKQQFSTQNLTGTSFIVIKGEWDDAVQKIPAHAYSFSMATYLKGQNARGTLQINKWQVVDKKRSLLTKLSDYRFYLNRHIERTFPKSLVAEAQALIFGDQQHVDDALNRAYQKLGITHLFAISGLHVALLSVFLYELLIRMKLRIQLAQTIIMVALPVYALLAGSAPSIWRAVLLVELLYIVKLWNGRIGIDDALSGAFIMSLLWQPAMLLQVGFQLSYIACASLVYSGRLLQQKYWWQQGFMMTFVCQLLAYPILLFHFYELSLSSFLANIVFVPLFSFVILPINVFLLVLTFVCQPLANVLFELYEPVRSLLTTIILQMQQVPFQMWVPGKPSSVALVLLLISVVASFVLWAKQRHALAAIVVIVPALLFSNRSMLQKDLTVSFVDVGQGDCIVIELPRRQAVYVIDSGGLLRFGEKDWKTKSNQYEVGKQVVVPFLKGKGIASVDKLILSHADADHVEGAEEIMEEIRVKEIHISPNSSTSAAMEDVLQMAAKQRVPIVEQIAGSGWQQGQANFKYLWPTETFYEGNNDSLVLLFEFAHFRALFTGDLEEQGEATLVKAGQLMPLTVLKAGHHGSKTSSSEAFIDTVKPKLTIFMAGRNNRYNHPHPDVVERFQQRQLATLSTKDVGTIEIRTNGQAINVITEKQ